MHVRVRSCELGHCFRFVSLTMLTTTITVSFGSRVPGYGDLVAKNDGVGFYGRIIRARSFSLSTFSLSWWCLNAKTY